MSARISDCGTYRYTLAREIPAKLGEEQERLDQLLFVMLNPSTADASKDDPTIRRCIGFARKLGYGHMAVGNLFAQRATKPEGMFVTREAIGPENDLWLERLATASDKAIVAWGANWRAAFRADDVLKILANCECPAYCLGTTKKGAPRHPLYVPASQDLVPFPPSPLGRSK